MKTISCIRCDRLMDNVFDGPGNQPDNGLEFSTKGHYGSTVFDPNDGSILAINVCDACLLAAGAAGNVLTAPFRRPAILKYALWEPHRECETAAQTRAGEVDK